MNLDAPVAAAGVGALGWAWLVLVFVALPWGAWRTKKLLDSDEDLGSRRQLLIGVAVQQVVLTALALLVAWREQVELFPASWPRPGGWAAAGALFLAAALTIPVRWRRANATERARLRRVGPSEPRDLAPWALVCALAGFGEEIAWRGVLPALLVRLGLSLEAAIGLAALSFALAHLTQGWGGLVPVFLFAVAFHLVVSLSGNLYAAMVAHTAYDLVAGLALLRYAQREGPPRANADSDG